MSSTGRGADRLDFDAYPTPNWCVHRLLEARYFPGGRWVETAAGDGAIVKAVSEVRSDVIWTANDIRPECRVPLLTIASHITIGDVAAIETPARPYDVAITNPPYRHAMAFVLEGLRLANVVALLLRSNFVGSQERAPFFDEHYPDDYKLPNRPTFVHREHYDPKKNKWIRTSSDSAEYTWCVFYRHKRSTGMSRMLAITPEGVIAEARRRAPVIRVDAEGRIVPPEATEAA